MEPVHRFKVIDLVPEARDKVFYLGEFYDRPADEEGASSEVMIPDPIGRPMAFYRAAFGLIKQSIEGLIREIKG